MLRALRSNMPLLVMSAAALMAFIALFATLAEGGGVWARVLLILLHPLCVAGLLALTPTPGLTRTTLFAIAGLQVLTVAADLILVWLIAGGYAEGNWLYPAAFASIPTVGIVYALRLAGTLPKQHVRVRIQAP